MPFFCFEKKFYLLLLRRLFFRNSQIDIFGAARNHYSKQSSEVSKKSVSKTKIASFRCVTLLFLKKLTYFADSLVIRDKNSKMACLKNYSNHCVFDANKPFESGQIYTSELFMSNESLKSHHHNDVVRFYYPNSEVSKFVKNYEISN